jgi:pilus assembly protein CpaF
VRLETRPPNLEGTGAVTMRDLVKNCLRMRPERIIVGEVRGPEVFDLLQAMNTGHDGSMGTLHANSPRECLSRIESMITMGGFTLPSKTLREMICSSIDVIIQAAAPARRIAPHHPHHRGDGHGRRGHHHAGPDDSTNILGEDAAGKLIGRIARPASAGRVSGSAPAISARSSGSPPRSICSKSRAKPMRRNGRAPAERKPWI